MKKYISLSVLLFNIFIMYSQIGKNIIIGTSADNLTVVYKVYK